MTAEEYFKEWWTPNELPENGFNKTAMLDFAETYASQQTQGEICAVTTNWTIKRHPSDLRKVMNADECRFIGSLDECVEFIKENFTSHSYQP